VQIIGSDQAVGTIKVRVTDPPLELFVTPEAFQPNPTTVRFSRTVRIRPGNIVFDIGTGIGPLAIMAAMLGARSVHAVDPVPLHCELARRSVEKYSLEEQVYVHEGCLFEPLDADPATKGLHADVIIGDVSGIADPVARALGWYSEHVPTGGTDGTEVIIELLRRAKDYLTPDGRIYFPIAVDLSDSEKIAEAARSLYCEAANTMDREYVNFPVSEREQRAIVEAYAGDPPSFITIHAGRRPYWRGQIWCACKPR
jgi:methylase of polypeptide subunit release factors